MKKGIFSLVAVGLMATAANAATIGLRWTDTPDAKHLGAGTAELHLTVLDGELISGANTDFVCVSGDCANVVIGNVAVGTPANWSANKLGGSHIGAPEFVGLTAFAQSPASGSIGAGDYILATFDVSFDGAADASEKGIGLDYLNNPGGGVINNVAAPLTWDARYNAVYSGYIAYGDYGWAAWSNITMMGAQLGQPGADSPLIISKVPEPTSLALVALGGFALLRRRSN
ncbi:MAG: PEP-CTERM sorting domain-containing protein [Phycisphaerales bacterium]|nr:PEP-CTERM sorting domain-containing protein [Phycisphaerales bacterium]